MTYGIALVIKKTMDLLFDNKNIREKSIKEENKAENLGKYS